MAGSPDLPTGTALRWSYRLLPSSLPVAFRDLAVLVGDFDLSAAGAVLDPGASTGSRSLADATGSAAQAPPTGTREEPTTTRPGKPPTTPLASPSTTASTSPGAPS